MKLAREGWEIVAIVAVLATLATVFFGGAVWFVWLLLLFSVQFFRDPNRVINTTGGEDAVLSPADGRVVFVGTAAAPVSDDDDTGSDKIKISIFMNVFNVHANHIPVAGEIVHSERFAGRFFNAALDKASTQNERHLINIKTTFGNVLCMQIAGLLARRVLCYAKVGDTVAAGFRYGFIRFGSRVDVYLPSHCRPTVAIGDKVTAGVNIIAQATRL